MLYSYINNYFYKANYINCNFNKLKLNYVYDLIKAIILALFKLKISILKTFFNLISAIKNIF